MRQFDDKAGDFASGADEAIKAGLESAVSEVRTSPRLDDRVIDRIRDIRSQQDAQVPHGRSPVLLPRVAVGAVACGLALAVAIGAMSSPASPSGTTQDSGTGASEASEHPFSLSIAQASETSKEVSVAATNDGIRPVSDEVSRSQELKLNLSVTGDNITSVTYRIVGSPTEKYRASVMDKDRFPDGVGTRDLVSLHQAVWGSYEQTEGFVAPEEGQFQPESITIDYGQRSADGSYHTADGVYHFVAASGDMQSYWDSDPTLQALDAWLDATLSPDGSDDNENPTPRSWDDTSAEAEGQDSGQERASRPKRTSELRAAYDSALADATSTPEKAYEWTRKNYISGFVTCNDSLSQARLEVTATFADGSTTTRLYRIELVDDYERVLSDRFDALCEAAGTVPADLIARTGLPWMDWDTSASHVRGESMTYAGSISDEQYASDPRLTAAMYTITDVTEE